MRGSARVLICEPNNDTVSPIQSLPKSRYDRVVAGDAFRPGGDRRRQIAPRRHWVAMAGCSRSPRSIRGVPPVAHSVLVAPEQVGVVDGAVVVKLAPGSGRMIEDEQPTGADRELDRGRAGFIAPRSRPVNSVKCGRWHSTTLLSSTHTDPGAWKTCS